jgi:hypothetical protein
MTGTVSQIEWAERIKPQVNAEFDRVAKALNGAAVHQQEQDRVDTRAIVAILEEKRAEVLAKDQAGYFIRHWQELKNQVRQLIAQDSRYQTIQAKRTTRLPITHALATTGAAIGGSNDT